MKVAEYVKSVLEAELGKYGINQVADAEIMAVDYVFQISEAYDLAELPALDLKGFLDERLVDYVAEYKKGNLFRYPVLDEDGELRFVLETFLTRGDVDAVLNDFTEEVDVEFVTYLEREGINVLAGFEKAITFA